MTRRVRKNFVESLKYESNKVKTFTENGAISYESSGKYILDFNFKDVLKVILNITHATRDTATASGIAVMPGHSREKVRNGLWIR